MRRGAPSGSARPASRRQIGTPALVRIAVGAALVLASWPLAAQPPEWIELTPARLASELPSLRQADNAKNYSISEPIDLGGVIGPGEQWTVGRLRFRGDGILYLRQHDLVLSAEELVADAPEKTVIGSFPDAARKATSGASGRNGERGANGRRDGGDGGRGAPGGDGEPGAHGLDAGDLTLILRRLPEKPVRIALVGQDGGDGGDGGRGGAGGNGARGRVGRSGPFGCERGGGDGGRGGSGGSGGAGGEAGRCGAGGKLTVMLRSAGGAGSPQIDRNIMISSERARPGIPGRGGAGGARGAGGKMGHGSGFCGGGRGGRDGQPGRPGPTPDPPTDPCAAPEFQAIAW